MSTYIHTNTCDGSGTGDDSVHFPVHHSSIRTSFDCVFGYGKSITITSIFIRCLVAWLPRWYTFFHVNVIMKCFSLHTQENIFIQFYVYTWLLKENVFYYFALFVGFRSTIAVLLNSYDFRIEHVQCTFHCICSSTHGTYWNVCFTYAVQLCMAFLELV